MIAGCIVFGAILLSIFVSAARSFPDFVRRMRIALYFAEGVPFPGVRPGHRELGA